MPELQMVTNPILLPPSSEVTSESTALVPAGRGRSAGLAIADRQATYTDDRYVWSVIPDDTGVYHFQSVPVQMGGQRDTGYTSGGSYSAGGFSTLQALNLRNAITQYRLHTAMPFPSLSQSVSFYC